MGSLGAALDEVALNPRVAIPNKVTIIAGNAR